MLNSWTADGSGEDYKALPSGPAAPQEEEVSTRMLNFLYCDPLSRILDSLFFLLMLLL